MMHTELRAVSGSVSVLLLVMKQRTLPILTQGSKGQQLIWHVK